MSLIARGLSFRYRDDYRYVLRDACIELNHGEVVSLIGLNGSGKSTLLRLLSGILSPVKGNVECDGKGSFLPGEAGIALAPSEPDDFLVGGTVEDEIAFGPENLGWKRQQIKRTVMNSLGNFKLNRMAGYDTDVLSEGQRKLVMLSAALAVRPNYLLIDELMRGMDKEAVLTVVEALKKSVSNGSAVLLTSTEEISGIESNRSVWLYDGKITGDKPVRLSGRQKEGLKNRDKNIYNKPRVRILKGELKAFDVEFEYPRGGHQDNFFRLHNFNLSVEPGGVVAIVGDNGSGKSTALSILAGVLIPAKGGVLLDGLPMCKKGWSPRDRLRVCLSPQRPSDLMHCDTVYEEVSLAMKFHRIQDAEKRTEESLSKLGIPELSERDPIHLSSCEQRVVSIACILAMEPDYIIADEPFAGLDSSSGTRVAEVLSKMANNGTGVVVSSTNVDCIPLDVDRTVLLVNGVAVGDDVHDYTTHDKCPDDIQELPKSA